MNRRWMAALAAGILLAGCGQVAPPGVDVAATSAPAAPIGIGSDGTPTGDLLAALYVAALEAKQIPAETEELSAAWVVPALTDGSPAVMPAFAATLLESVAGQVSPDDDPETIISDLATAIEPELGVLQASRVDGALVWTVTTEVADEGVGDLSSLGEWGPERVVAAPSFALDSGAGVPALQVAYGSQAGVLELDDPDERLAALQDGRADAAAFRRTEATQLAGLVELSDPIGMGAPDPLVAVLNSDLAQDRPDVVLVIDAVQQALTTESLAALQSAAAARDPEQAIGDWLSAEGLAG